jgi:hypothetical protein
VFKISSGNYKTTNPLVPGQKCKINTIIPTEEPWKLYLGTDKGLQMTKVAKN